MIFAKTVPNLESLRKEWTMVTDSLPSFFLLLFLPSINFQLKADLVEEKFGFYEAFHYKEEQDLEATLKS